MLRFMGSQSRTQLSNWEARESPELLYFKCLQENYRVTKGTFHAKMGTMKDRNGMDLTEAEDIKRKWQEYTGELYTKDLHNHNGVITHLEPDILE